MSGIKIAGRIAGILVTVFLAFLLFCNVYMIAVRGITGEKMPRVFGYTFAVIVSGSMSGSIEVNDMVVIHQEEAYAPGDVITFESGSSIVTHRIVEATADGYITRGDANNVADQEMTVPENVIGRVVWVIPGVGRLIELLRTPLGMLCLVLAGFLLIALPAILDWMEEKWYHGGNGNERN